LTIDQRDAQRSATNGTHSDGTVRFSLPARDVRRKRPAALSFLLRLETLRRVARVASLLILDYIGVFAAIWTVLALKLAFRNEFHASLAWHDTKQYADFGYLVTVLMFARVDLYADRPRRPGLAGIATALFQATVIAALFALANGEHFSTYSLFYGSLFFGIVYITTLRYAHTLLTGKVLEKLDLPAGVHVSGLESDGGDRFFCGGATSGKVRAIRRPRRGSRVE